MNKTFDSIAADTANIALDMMTIEERRAAIKAAADKINKRAEHHRIAIEKAIADALEDGFDVWVESRNNNCFFDHEETDYMAHVTVD